MPPIKRELYRDNIASINANFLKNKLNIKKSQCDNFRWQVMNYLVNDMCELVMEYYESKDVNVLFNYIELNGILEDHFKKEPTRRLIIECILQEKMPREEKYVLPKDVIMCLARILFHKMKIIAQDFQ